jgi:hypothetical protein
MKLVVALRDLSFSVKPDGGRVILRFGGFRFTASRSEAVQLATAIVRAVDDTAVPQQQQEGTEEP